MQGTLLALSMVHGGVHFTRSEVLKLAGTATATISASSVGLSLPADASYVTTSVNRQGAVLYDCRTGTFMPASPQKYLSVALENDAATSSTAPRVFFAGEEHTQELHHTVQLDMIKAVDEIDEAPTYIGLEMCYRQHQRALDAFVYGDASRGGGDLDLLAQRTNWLRSWGYPIELYTPILSFARERRLRLCGLNAPYAVVDAVSRVGLEGLPAELRHKLPEVDLTNSEHRRRFVEAIGGSVDADGQIAPPTSGGAHGPMTSEEVQHSYEAMALWDDFMASSIAGYLSSPKPVVIGDGAGDSAGDGADGAGNYNSVGDRRAMKRMVVLVGSSHVRGRVGLPDRYTRRAKLPTFTMVSLSVPWNSVANKPILADAPLEASEADWVLYTKASPPPERLSSVSARRFSSAASFM